MADYRDREGERRQRTAKIQGALSRYWGLVRELEDAGVPKQQAEAFVKVLLFETDKDFAGVWAAIDRALKSVPDDATLEQAVEWVGESRSNSRRRSSID